MNWLGIVPKKTFLLTPEETSVFFDYLLKLRVSLQQEKGAQKDFFQSCFLFGQ